MPKADQWKTELTGTTPTTYPVYKHKPSAATGSAKQLPRVEAELTGTTSTSQLLYKPKPSTTAGSAKQLH